MADTADLQRPGAVATRFSASNRESVIFYTSRTPQILELSRTPDVRGPDGGRNIQPGAGQDDWCCPPPPPPPGVKPFIATPGQLTSMTYRSLNCVYGLRIDQYVTMLSPANRAFNNAKTCSGWSALAACGDGSATGWLYYASNRTADSTQDPLLTQYDLQQGQPNWNLPSEIPIDPCYLSAIFLSDVQQRWVIYQVPNPQKSPGLRILQLAGVNQAVTNGEITATRNAVPQTPQTMIANEQNVYLYYISSVGGDTTLSGVQRPRNATGNANQWQPRNIPPAGFQFSRHLQLSSLLLPNGVVRIFQENPNFTPGSGQEQFLYLDDTITE